MREVTVPARANLIGEHTDYNDGLALPFAIDLGVTVVRTTPTDDARTVDAGAFGTWRFGEPTLEEWQRQAHAVLVACDSGPVHLRVSSTVPVGAGLSSSAAYLGALALALDAPGGLFDLARFVQACESVAGNDVGLLDQLATLGARADHALLIDFASDTVDDVAWPEGLAATAVHSGVSRSLANTEYQTRRRECSRAVAVIGPWREASLADLDRLDDPVLRARARHVITENERVVEVVDAMRRGDVTTIGRAIDASHRSLSEHFEVSTPEIDRLVEHLRSERGVLGVRLVGGGFGGCVLVIHEPSWHPESSRRSWPLVPSDGALARLARRR